MGEWPRLEVWHDLGKCLGRPLLGRTLGLENAIAVYVAGVPDMTLLLVVR